MSLFPKSFYNNTLKREEVIKDKELPIVRDLKQDLETGELIRDDKGDFIIIEGIEALVQICKRKLQTEFNKWMIYPKDFGSRLYLLNGKSKYTAEMYAEQFIVQAIVDKKYVTNIKDLTITREDKGYYTIEFTIITVYGNTELSIKVEAKF